MNIRACQTELHEAAANGRILQLRSLLAQGTNVNAVTEHLDTPLHEACWAGKALCVKELLRNSAEVNAKNISGVTPLFNACWSGSVSCCKALLQAGADPNAGYKSCIKIAVKRGWWKCVVELVMDKGCLLSPQEKAIWTPSLHIPATNNDMVMLKTLLSLGVSPHQTNSKQMVAKDLAASTSECYKILSNAEKHPLSLMELCRLCLLHHKLIRPYVQLDVPNRIKSFLQFENASTQISQY